MVETALPQQLRTCTFQPQPWCGKHLSDQEPPAKNVYNYATKKDSSDKTPMCRIAELARFNKVKHEYILLDEDGPAHKKRFTVKLVLREGEEFEGSGASIKKAQQAAAEIAVEKTTLQRPPTKAKRAKKDINHPSVLLNYVAGQLGITLQYFDKHYKPAPWECDPGAFMLPPVPFIRPPIPNAKKNMMPPPFPLLPALPRGFPFPQRYAMPPFQMMPPQPFMNRANGHLPGSCRSTIKLSDGTEHSGEGPNKQEARNNAATEALKHLKPKLAELEAKLSKLKVKENSSSNSSESSASSTEEGDKENHTDAIDLQLEEQLPPNLVFRRGQPKSVVSQIHECALRLKMNVEFEVLKESGEPHKRMYLVRCQLAGPGKEPIQADGEGSSKKFAKQEACRKMLDKLQGIEEDPLYLASVILMNHKRNGAASSNAQPKRRTIIKDMKMDPQYGHHINPISRLIQVMQSQKQPEPVFRLVDEQGQNRYKEFTIEVACQDVKLNGTGPNKKLAKRAAAEAMLQHIGYIKPMPLPGKSLLKKRASESVDIGVFDPSDFNAKAGAEETNSPSENADSPTAIETFADVDHAIKEVTISPPSPETPSDAISDKNDANEDLECGKVRRRRVTFSNQVSACPPPEDANYPEASIAPLKSEVVVVSKLKKRGKDSKRSLSVEEKAVLVSLCHGFMAYPGAKAERKGWVFEQPPLPDHNWADTPIKTAKEYLETLALAFKFTVAYSDFPKSEGPGQQYWSLVTVGLDKPIVCQGGGASEECAHNDAAFSALIKLIGELSAPIAPV